MRVFRWKAIVPLLLFGALVTGLWILFADRFAKRTTESIGTTLVGAKVEIDRMHLDIAHGRVEVRGLTVASPFEALENLLQADLLVADLEPLPLLEKKLVIDRLAATGLRFGTPRQSDGRTVGQSDGVMGQVERWGQQLQVPALQLATGKISLDRLDPAQLNTPRLATALAAQADSSRKVWESSLNGLGTQAAVDSSARMVERLKGGGVKLTDVKLLGDARRTLDQVKHTEERLTALERSVTSGLASLKASAAGLTEARQRDYALARGLLKLPGLDAPDIGAALFGRAAVQRFQRALYWAQLARRYMPPGLLPRATSGPRRVRRAGTTVHFPRANEPPAFLLKSADLSLSVASHAYSARLTGVTSDPALYGRPAEASGTAPGFRLAALLDHVRATPRDTAAASLADVALPSLRLPPPLGARVEPGAGAVGFRFAMQGDQVQARWTVTSDRVRWVRDSSGGRSSLGDVVWRAISGISTLEVSARLAGDLEHPELAVGSNLDRAIADRLRAMAGTEVAAAERRVRAQVDSLTDGPMSAARSKVAALGGEVTGRLGGQRAQLDQARRALEQRLPGLRLP